MSPSVPRWTIVPNLLYTSDQISSIIPTRPLIPFMISSNGKSMTDYRLQNVFTFIWIISYFVEVLIRFQSSAIAYNKYEIYIDPNSYCTVFKKMHF